MMQSQSLYHVNRWLLSISFEKQFKVVSEQVFLSITAKSRLQAQRLIKMGWCCLNFPSGSQTAPL
ncbi:hypothetical protein [Listonella phage phiHSIC]|uniref:hypothetical protein n=1 Tax=Listonella phage phiHSIC TaxID=310539 RepID=UPI00004C73FF|nr:hypothetical protein LPPPVgp06 [Listonella phage phiHSIC]AAW67503.1 hypothetical protein [Listonella phage phiHSIC]